MKHSLDDLLDIVYRHYPRKIPSYDPRYTKSEEYVRLAEARRHAAAEQEPWRAMLRRLDQQFPEPGVQNRSLHLQSMPLDACYSGALHLPNDHSLGFFVSFLVPYYVLYSSRLVDDPDATEARRVAKEKQALEQSKTVDIYLGNTMIVLPAEDVTPELKAELEKLDKRIHERNPEMLAIEKALAEQPCRRQEIRLEVPPDAQPYAARIAVEIEATFGHELMPPEVGSVIVPDVTTSSRLFWEARIYDCLMSDHW
jgi:hypothetical protein